MVVASLTQGGGFALPWAELSQSFGLKSVASLLPLRENWFAAVAGLDRGPDDWVHAVVDAVDRAVAEEAVQALRVAAVEVVDVRRRTVRLVVAAAEHEQEVPLDLGRVAAERHLGAGIAPVQVASAISLLRSPMK